MKPVQDCEGLALSWWSDQNRFGVAVHDVLEQRFAQCGQCAFGGGICS